MRTWSLRLLRQLFRIALSALHMLATAASAAFKSRATLHLENLALRHQLGVLRRSVKRPKLTSADRLLWAWLYEAWSDWRSALVIVKPETVIAWHRKGFRLFWIWRVRHGQPGRPPVSKEIRQLIRKMSRDNPLWGAPRIHGELLKLGIDIGETSVGKYIVHTPKPPSQTWRTFLENQVKTMVSIDFYGHGCAEFGSIGDLPWSSSSRKPSLPGTARAFGCFGPGEFVAVSLADRRSRKTCEC